MREHVRLCDGESVVGDKFIRALVAIDEKISPRSCPDQPVSAYLGADINDSKETAKFLRSGLNPLLIKYNCGLVLVHHTPKTNQRDTTGGLPQTGCMLALVPPISRTGAARVWSLNRKSLRLFKFIAAKRGSRIGSADDISGDRETSRYFAHSIGSNMFWRDAEQTAVTAAKNEPSKRDDILALIPAVGSIAKKSGDLARRSTDAADRCSQDGRIHFRSDRERNRFHMARQTSKDPTGDPFGAIWRNRQNRHRNLQKMTKTMSAFWLVYSRKEVL